MRKRHPGERAVSGNVTPRGMQSRRPTPRVHDPPPATVLDGRTRPTAAHGETGQGGTELPAYNASKVFVPTPVGGKTVAVSSHDGRRLSRMGFAVAHTLKPRTPVAPTSAARKRLDHELEPRPCGTPPEQCTGIAVPNATSTQFGQMFRTALASKGSTWSASPRRARTRQANVFSFAFSPYGTNMGSTPCANDLTDKPTSQSS